MYLQELGIICAAGGSHSSLLSTCLSGRGRRPEAVPWLHTDIPAYAVTASLPSIPERLKIFDCRNNRLLLAALAQIEAPAIDAIKRYGSDRVALVLGTSTSGIAEGEYALEALQASGRIPQAYHYKQQELGGAVEFLTRYLGICGPAYTISTTCSSSANALASARRLLRLGLCDAVLVGGADSLCRTTLEGFAALSTLSRTGCNPFSKNRDGTVIGEGAALFLMSREPSAIALLGAGASADAYHVSAPRPDGSCAQTAMKAALHDAGLSPEQVDYINLHGTATEQNDAMESKAVASLFGKQTLCGSSKAFTGHCLGAAGAIEAGLCWLLLSETNNENCLPPHLWDGEADPELPGLNFVTLENSRIERLQYCLSNSFSFGGNNVSLLIGRR
ncbi:MAG: beta-ketoacyl-ACP synthase [Gammaproteobacteria bacterium]